MLRMVPLPRFAGAERKRHDKSIAETPLSTKRFALANLSLRIFAVKPRDR